MTAISATAIHPGTLRAGGYGLLAFGLLIALYFGVLAALSGWAATVSEFREFWYFVIPLATGFGLQVGLYARLRQMLKEPTHARAVTAASGATSTAAMLSCCAHYLVNVAPVLGATGLVALAAQYQVELFSLGIAFNLAGIAYIGNTLRRATREHRPCLHA